MRLKMLQLVMLFAWGIGSKCQETGGVFGKQSRVKRSTSLPMGSVIRFQSRLIVPNPPSGVAQVWLGPIRFRISSLLSSRSTNQIASMIARELGMTRSDGSHVPISHVMSRVSRELSGRSLSVQGKVIAEDQLHTYQMIEKALDDLGAPGKSCLLRAICEMQQINIGEWTYIGETLTNFLTPKTDLYAFLSDYQQAYRLGSSSAVESESTSCQTVYSKCPMSVFNFIPAIVGEDLHLHLGNVTQFVS